MEVEQRRDEMRALIGEPYDELTIEQLNERRVKQLEPMLKAAVPYLAARNAEDAPEIALLESLIATTIERVRVLEIAQMNRRILSAVDEPYDQLTVDELNERRVGFLEPLLFEAVPYLDARDAGDNPESIGKLEACISAHVERVRHLEVCSQEIW